MLLLNYAAILKRSSGESDLELLGRIFNLLGTPSPQSWPGVDMLPKYIEFEARQPLKLSTLFGEGKERELNIFLRMLELDPLKRITAAQVMHMLLLIFFALLMFMVFALSCRRSIILISKRRRCRVILPSFRFLQPCGPRCKATNEMLQLCRLAVIVNVLACSLQVIKCRFVNFGSKFHLCDRLYIQKR